MLTCPLLDPYLPLLTMPPLLPTHLKYLHTLPAGHVPDPSGVVHAAAGKASALGVESDAPHGVAVALRHATSVEVREV